MINFSPIKSILIYAESIDSVFSAIAGATSKEKMKRKIDNKD